MSRSGVQLEEGQKSLIKSLMATGDVAGAQAIILKELETQYSGQAAAAVNSPLGQWAQLGNAIGDVREELGREIVPFLKPVVKSVGEAVKWFAELDPAVKKNIVVFGGIAAAAGPVLGILGMATIGIGGLAGAFTTLSAVLWANPIVAIIGAVAVGAALIYRNWDSIAGYFSGVFESVKTTLGNAWAWIKDRFLTSWHPVALIYRHWDQIGDFFTGLGGRVKGAFGSIWAQIVAEVSTWPGKMRDWGAAAIAGFVDGVLGVSPQLRGDSREVGTAVADGILSGLADGQGRATGAARGLAGAVTDAAKDELGIQSPSKIFQQIGSDVVGGLVQGIAANGNAAVDEVRGLTAQITQEGQKAGRVMDGIRNSAKSAFTSVLTGASTVKQAASSMLSGLGNRLIGSAVDGLFDAVWPFAKGAAFSGGRVTAFANGGVVGSPTYFGMRGGTGLMGEAGPEGILPLARTSGGKLGVHTTGGGGGVARVEVALDVPEGVTVRQVEQISGGIAVSVFQSGAQAQRAAMPATQANMVERYT
jgi:hypothetical protein